MLSSDQKGAIAEAAISHAALALGVGVARPFGDERYDLIFDFHPGLFRVQCKWARRHRGVVSVGCYSARRRADGVTRRLYSDTEVDAFAVYCAEIGRCYFVPFSTVPPSGAIALRLAHPRNNQHVGVRWAADFEFTATLRTYRGP